MHHLKITLLLLFGTLHIALQAQETNTGTMSLEGAINYALDNSNVIANARLGLQDAELLIKERLSTGLPNINAGLNFQHYLQVPVQAIPPEFLPPGTEGPTEVSFLLKNNFTADIGLQTMVFDGSFFVGLRAAREARNYAQLQLDTEARQVKNQVVDAYLPVLLISENLNVLDRNIENLRTLFNETSALYESGFVELLDVDRLRLSLDNLQTERENLEQQRENVLRALKLSMNYPMDQPLVVEDELDLISVAVEDEDLRGSIPFAQRPELLLLDRAIALQDLNTELQRSAYLPSVYANAGYQYQYQGNTLSDGFWAPTGVIGLNVNIPIYDFGGRRARVQRAQIERDNVFNQRKDLQNLITLEVTNARNSYLTAQRTLEARVRSLELAQRIYDTTQIKYREGVGSSLEVVQAEQALYEAQANELNATYELLVAKETLYQALGKR
ncbi:MAG: TolC family protein [Bacteroidota bacterium]